MVSQARHRYTPEEYLRLERDSDVKHEYFDGEVFAMAGASPAHVRICSNVLGELYARLKGTPCMPYGSDMRVKVSESGLYTYPDVVVVCGEPRFSDDNVEGVETLINPTVIVEVLSPSTEAYDRGRKFALYRANDSLTDYVLIAQDRRSAEHYARQSNDFWEFHDASNDAALRLASIGCELALDDIYYRVIFPAPDQPPPEHGDDANA